MHESLLHQARLLATIDRKKPRQANLRRAVSTAYYSLFHLLVDVACRAQLGSNRRQAGYRGVLGRAFTHTVMREACKSFRGGTLKQSVARGLPSGFSILPPIRDISSMFVELQYFRHQADYDMTERFRRSEVITLLDDLESTKTDFVRLGACPDKSFFLACLWAWRELSSR